MKNKLLILFFFSILFIFIFNVFLDKKEKIKIAVCPTYHKVSEKLNSKKYEVILTSSTAESLELLKKKRVSMILSGRKLKPNEPDMEFLILDDGFSFLAKKEMIINKNELINYIVYTDLEVNSIKNIFPIGDIEKVDDVYKYIDEGIIITSWENTDYNKAQIVHLMEDDNTRLALSRRQTIYCPNYCDKDAQEVSLLIKK